jgi:hypothetical protein
MLSHDIIEEIAKASASLIAIEKTQLLRSGEPLPTTDEVIEAWRDEYDRAKEWLYANTKAARDAVDE